jgi:hypothetical protein
MKLVERSWERVVSIATRLHDPWFQSQQSHVKLLFFKPLRPSQEPTQTHTHKKIFKRKQLGREFGYWPPHSAEVKNKWS